MTHVGKRGPFKVLAMVNPVAYQLELPQELSGVHNTFHVFNIKKCLSDRSSFHKKKSKLMKNYTSSRNRWIF
nr:reverse transcriptase domain-containing protein [Tanacetum cinerariifolium]